MDTFRYFILLNKNEKDCFFKLDLVRGYCDKRCSLCNKCSNIDIVKSVEHSKIDFYEKYLINHQLRAASLCKQLASNLYLNDRETFILMQSALLHDVGKLGISENILMKKDKLTAYESAVLNKHPIISAIVCLRILEDIRLPIEIIKVIEHHHERYDGKGYPDGLKGDEIPYLARILTVCDAYDAMTAGRHYKKRLSTNEALKELNENMGSQFDIDIADEFISMLQEKEASKVV